MAPPRRAIIAITSAHAPLYPEGKETGLFVTEALHPFKVFRDAGFEVDLVSETGTYQPDWLSLTADWLPEEDKKIWEDHSSEFRSKLDKLLKPSDIKAEQVSRHSVQERGGSLLIASGSTVSSSPPQVMHP